MSFVFGMEPAAQKVSFPKSDTENGRLGIRTSLLILIFFKMFSRHDKRATQRVIWKRLCGLQRVYGPHGSHPSSHVSGGYISALAEHSFKPPSLHEKNRPHQNSVIIKVLTRDIIRNRLKKAFTSTLSHPSLQPHLTFVSAKVILCLLSPLPAQQALHGLPSPPRNLTCGHPTLLSYGEKFSPAQLLAPNVETRIYCSAWAAIAIPLTRWLTLQNCIFSQF